MVKIFVYFCISFAYIADSLSFLHKLIMNYIYEVYSAQCTQTVGKGESNHVFACIADGHLFVHKLIMFGIDKFNLMISEICLICSYALDYTLSLKRDNHSEIHDFKSRQKI